MFNPEKLLGGLLKGSLGNTSGMGTKAAVGMGVLGVAMAAADHFLSKNNSPDVQPGMQPGAQPAAHPVPPGAPNAAPPMPPGAPAAAPPPPPPGATAPAPPEAQPETQPDSSAHTQAILLIRAMIASANADGVVDAQEFMRIMDKLESVGLNTEERAFIKAELNAPLDLESIASQVDSPELARQVYAVSLMAVDVDTSEEKNYLDQLQQKLELTPEDVASIRDQLLDA